MNLLRHQLANAFSVKLKIAVCALALFSVSSASSQTTKEIDLEWPCIQAYVPEVAVAVVWPEPIEEDSTGLWLKDSDAKKVVNELGALEVFDDAVRDRIQEIAESVPDAERIATYTKLADGIVYRFNQRRSDYFKGIRKFTRQQIAVSGQIQDHLNELVSLQDKSDAESLSKVAEIKETTVWQQRIFDRRESAIRLLCETPVDLESLLGDILRDLAQYLP